MSKLKNFTVVDDLPFKDVPIKRKPGEVLKARFPPRDEVGELPIPTFISFADADERPQWPKINNNLI